MKYPNFLKENDTIGLVAPSFGCTTSPYKERLDSAINFFSKNYKISEGKNIKKYYQACSAKKELRAKELNDAFLDSNIDIIASVGGGEIMTDILEYLDKEAILNNPKFFFGYSDNTNLTFILNTNYDIASIYSINFPSFGLIPQDESCHDTLSLLRGEKLKFRGYDKYLSLGGEFEPLDGIIPDTKNIYKTSTGKKIEIEGRLIGGCLDILVGLVGTEFDKMAEFIEKYNNEKILWYLECCDLNPIEIYRSLLQLKRAGWFNNASGIIFGRPRESLNQELMGFNEYNAATEVLDLPMAFDLDFGHIPLSIPILSGSYAKVNVDKDNFEIEYFLI